MICVQAQELTTASSADSDTREFRVVVHVHSDYAFKKYLNTCSATDLTLYRGLLLAVRDHDLSDATAVCSPLASLEPSTPYLARAVRYQGCREAEAESLA